MSYLDKLDRCCDSLRSSIRSISTSVETLDSGTYDFDRITQILKSKRHFQLVSEAQLQLQREEIEHLVKPKLLQAFCKLEHAVELLQQQESSLKSKCQLLSARLDTMRNRPSSAFAPAEQFSDQLKATIAKRQRLLYTLERYKLQLQQKQGY
ncbi:DASH complex subunit Spc19 [Schizosaccharomyces japonicus yFS275]|uniref:DASH complex subunit SPC19 n=1 Tax=Schizosaccharomyces japonicus (strain yFS275 / FY16936) TaxID=402676 RepID=B6K005_SCHJY|nr:DASH complex subunit Spc19 [Schizosaccharomyces japonicus yFS275]EEB06155.1 DASH complex subunit Spc19 [Schizosaccharomyces japonicus yFS275]